MDVKSQLTETAAKVARTKHKIEQHEEHLSMQNSLSRSLKRLCTGLTETRGRLREVKQGSAEWEAVVSLSGKLEKAADRICGIAEDWMKAQAA